MRGAAERIAAEVTSWKGVASAPHRFAQPASPAGTGGGVELRMAKRRAPA